MAAAGVECPTSVAEVCFEWVKLTSAGLQVSFHATAPYPGGDPPDPQVPMRQAMSEISLTDDAGNSYDLSAVLGGLGPEWRSARMARSRAGGTVALCDPCAASTHGAGCAGSDRQCELIEDRAELVMGGDVGGDVVVAAAQVLDERVTSGQDPC